MCTWCNLQAMNLAHLLIYMCDICLHAGPLCILLTQSFAPIHLLSWRYLSFVSETFVVGVVHFSLSPYCVSYRCSPFFSFIVTKAYWSYDALVASTSGGIHIWWHPYLAPQSQNQSELAQVLWLVVLVRLVIQWSKSVMVEARAVVASCRVAIYRSMPYYSGTIDRA